MHPQGQSLRQEDASQENGQERSRKVLTGNHLRNLMFRRRHSDDSRHRDSGLVKTPAAPRATESSVLSIGFHAKSDGIYEVTWSWGSRPSAADVASETLVGAAEIIPAGPD